MIILIGAFDLERQIGAAATLIWKIKKDMQHFKDTTMGNICIMGRVTWESIPENFRPLEGRKNIVVTSNPNYAVPDGVLIAANLDAALALTEDVNLMKEFAGKDIYICGGQQLYEAAMPVADALEVTEIVKIYNTEDMKDIRYFPEIDPVVWYAVSSETLSTENGLIFDFIRYERQS